MKIAVGSHNPVKLEAVRLAFEKVFPQEQWEIVDVAVESGVPDQPMSDEESVRGARNRAMRALDQMNADYGVGLEGGLEQVGNEFFDSGWIVVADRKGRQGVGSTLKIVVPPPVMDLVRQGMEMGSANDAIFGTQNSKQSNGHFGLMTKNAITRTDAYRDGVISALARFLRPELFEEP